MNDLISIILPVYNVENYIEKSIMSICNQTYRNIEIIIIDDGSQDNSISICKKINDDRMKIYSQKNKGVSAARNYGLNMARGSYIIFADSDDYFQENMIEELYKNIIKYDVDISICNYRLIGANGEVKLNKSNNSDCIFYKEKFITNLLEKTTYRGYLWNKLIKKDIINNIKFNENIHIMEDLIFLLEISDNVEKIYYDKNLYLYNYVQRKDSSLKKISKKYFSILSAFPIIFNYIQPKSELYNRYMFDYIQSSMLIYSDNNNWLTKEDKKKIKRIRDINFKYAMKSKKNNIYKKIKLILMSYFSPIYKCLKIIKKRCI